MSKWSCDPSGTGPYQSSGWAFIRDCQHSVGSGAGRCPDQIRKTQLTSVPRFRARYVYAIGGAARTSLSSNPCGRRQMVRRAVELSVPITLAVADRETWEKVQPPDPRNPPYFVPNSQGRKSKSGSIEGLVVLPARIEDFPSFELMKAAPDLLAEAISFHEAGHIVAAVPGIGSQNAFVNELIANFFMVGYVRAVRAGHPEFTFMTSDVASRLGSQKYRSLADLDYLYLDVGGANYAWFQFRLNLTNSPTGYWATRTSRW